MPLVIYIFSLCAFALGLTEFLVIGLVSAISIDLDTTIEMVGMTVTSYAVGATVGAPFLTALTSAWSRKTVMLITMLFFSIGSLAATGSIDMNMMLVSRFIAGLAHGLFLAVAASVATQMVPPEKRGAAVAYVFAGLTLALAFGVPIGTYLGTIISWRMSFMAVTVCGLIGLLGLLFFMPNTKVSQHNKNVAALQALTYIFDAKLLFGALITVLAYTGAFTLYTYIAPVLYAITQVSIQTASYMMLIYGVCAAIGNFIGGKLTDKLGVDNSVTVIMFALTISLVSIHFYATSMAGMMVFMGALGIVSYAAVPAMQARVISIANLHVAAAIPVASGLNIAGFNLGIALGSLIGGGIITTAGISYLAIGGASIAFIGLLIMLLIVLQHRKKCLPK